MIVVVVDAPPPGQVAKQWYDYERSSFNFVKLAKELKSPLTFRKTADFDENGIIFWIGSNARSALLRLPW